MILIIIACALLFISIYFSAKLDRDALIAKKAQVLLFDKDGQTIPNESLYRYVSFDELSPHLVGAFVALEDKRFYKHHGVDYVRLFGALAKDISTLSWKEGGSTLTQQLAKNTQLSGEKTLVRKIKEMRIARLIERQFTKNEILELYLNAIYFGNGIYGIDSAAKNYFNKRASTLSPAESALLAGIVKNPGAYSPKTDPEKSVSRRNLVLRKMLEQGYLSEPEYETAVKTSYVPIDDPFAGENSIPFFHNALYEASTVLGVSEKELLTMPVNVYTRYSPSDQAILADIFRSKEYDAPDCYYSTLLSDNDTRYVSAFFSNTNINVFTFRKQPASTIKPILVYAPALENGMITPQTYLNDVKININGYSPKNFGGKYHGYMTASDALAASVNTVAVSLLQELGVENGKKFASRCGIRFSERDGLASALGGLTDGTTQKELLESYMTIANGGIHGALSFVEKITDHNGKILYKNHRFVEKSMSSATAFLITDMLRNTVQNGTARKLSGFSFDLAAKTGTTQSAVCNANDCAWSVSFSPKNSLLVWYGAKDTSKGTLLTGGGMPTMLARKVYASIPAPQNKRFTIPDTVVSVEIDKYAQEKAHETYLANYSTPTQYRKKAFFSVASVPTASSPYFDLEKVSFTLDTTADKLQITVRSPQPYEYVLEERDVFGTLRTYTIPADGTWEFPQPTNHGCLTIYRLDVLFEGKPLGYVSAKQIGTKDASNERFPRFEPLDRSILA